MRHPSVWSPCSRARAFPDSGLPQILNTHPSKHDTNRNSVNLAKVVRRMKPAILIGAERPIVFALSNPPAPAEANPADPLAWTDARAPIAARPFGSPKGSPERNF